MSAAVISPSAGTGIVAYTASENWGKRARMISSLLPKW